MKKFTDIEDSEKDRGSKFLKKFYLERKKVYDQDIVFMELKFNKNEYIAKPVEFMIPESVDRNLFKKTLNLVYGNLNTNSFLFEYKRGANTYLVESEKNFKWDIKNEYEVIAGFKSRKAVLQVEGNPKLFCEAWFTSQIPVAFSPVKYYGLPGAILKVTTTFNHIYAKNIKFKDDVQIDKPTKGIKLSGKEYNKMMSNYSPN
jgi:GLPGLI family protein